MLVLCTHVGRVSARRRQEVMGHVVGQYVAQQLPVVCPRLAHFRQFPFGLAFPQEVQPGRDLDQSGVVRHQHQEHDQQQQHLRRQRHGPVVGVVLREHLRIRERREPRVHGHHDRGQERLHQEVQLKRGGQGDQAQHPREHQVLRVYAVVGRFVRPPSVTRLPIIIVPGVHVVVSQRFLPDQMFVRREHLQRAHRIYSISARTRMHAI